MGVQLGFMGVQLGGKVTWAGSRGSGCGCGKFRAAAGGCHHACQMMEPRDADAAALLTCSSVPLTAIVVSAGQMLWLVMRSGGAAAARLREAGPANSCCVSLGW